MGISRVLPATEALLQAVTTANCKTHMRITHATDDTYIAALSAAASVYVGKKTGRSLVAATYDYTIDAFSDKIEIPHPPLTSITTIKYYDTDGAEQTIADTVYTVYTDVDPGWVGLAYAQSWPTARAIPETITIRFICGSSTVPAELQHAVKLLVEHWYEHREAIDVSNVMAIREVPMALEALIWLNKVPTLR